MHTQTDRQQGDLISLLLFLQKKQSILKTELREIGFVGGGGAGFM
jgi:hypothetical protein